VPDFRVSLGEDGELTLKRTGKTPFNARLLLVPLAGVAVALLPVVSLFSPSSVMVCAFSLAFLAPAAFLFVSDDYADVPTRLLVRDRIVIGERGPLGQRLVRVDGRTWPAGEGCDVLVASQRFRLVDDPTYSLLLLLPDGFTELWFGTETEGARRLQGAICAALGIPPIEASYSPPKEEDDDTRFGLVLFASWVLASAGTFPTVILRHVPIPVMLAVGAWAVAVGWGAGSVMRARLKKSGPERLHHARAFAKRNRTHA
jgi:hypothetical protein